MCAGVLSAVLSTVAAGIPMMFTSELSPPPMIPMNGWGRGVGTGGEPGTITIWVSVAEILSPCFAAGCPMARCSVPSVDIDGSALDVERAVGLHVEAAARFDFRIGRGLQL